MTDTVNQQVRSRIMSRVRNKDTKPEMLVRRLIFSLGYRYRLHGPKLPGKPDLVFAGRKKVIFVHGCFWHRHEGCRLARLPKSRVKFWTTKLSGNRERDIKNQAALRKLGWDILVIWECEIANEEQIRSQIISFLDGVEKHNPV